MEICEFVSLGGLRGHCILLKALFFCKKKNGIGMYVIALFLLQFFSGIPVLFGMFYAYKII